ncbi:MAG: hypothetical protein EXR57_06835 [Dehalococcoidia bacterium]|nr:hypothetical protein [Dehalococcoidia bacterium]MSQ35504.1 hypothetical protein [Dehalococcoidia bacterium]
MRLIIAGCENSGTSTLAHAIDDWMEATMGGRFNLLHDHYKLPHTSGHPDDTTHEEQAQIMALSPKIKEMVQRHSLYYHVQPASYDVPDWLVIGLHIDDSVYGPLYFGYGGDGQPHDRKIVSRQVESAVLRFAPDVVLVHVKAPADVIARRMKERPQTPSLVKEKDIPRVLQLFEDAVARSTITRKIVVDTSAGPVQATASDFAKKIEKYLTDTDRLRILTHRALRGGAQSSPGH